MPNVEFAKKAVVKVQPRSAFDKSFRNLLTTKCGTLTPILCDEVIPNSTINLKLALSATLPPLASETFMNVNLKAEAFFIPTRLIMTSWPDFVQGNTSIKVGGSAGTAVDGKLRVPLVKLTTGASDTVGYTGSGTLADYLGMKAITLVNNEVVYVNALPFLAYHYLWSTWYRNSLVQKDCFYGSDFFNTTAAWNPAAALYKKPIEAASNSNYITTLGYTLEDGVKLGQLRQRNFGSDYFTTATPSPQNGAAQKISMVLPSGLSIISSAGNVTGDFTPASGSALDDMAWSGTIGEDSTFEAYGADIRDSHNDLVSTSFTIASLRAANSLQIWLERQNLSNNRYVDYLKVNYNADLKDSIAQRPVYLGSASFPVYTKGIYQTAADSNSGNNPFDSVGSRYGHAYAEGTDFIIDHYTAQEHGYIMVLVSLVPEVTYSSGVATYLSRYCDSESYGEVANPILQNIGQQPIKCSELDGYYYDDSKNAVFGYTDRFGDWMTRNHELHGLLSDGSTLDAFALQRSFLQATSSMLQITSNFLQIPTNYMDQVTAVDSAISNYGCWIDSYLDYKVVMPLAKYSIPSLQDPAYEHGDTVVVNRRGRIME